jgi:hypothetical protein
MATIDHNFGDQNNYLVVPVSGIVKITVSTSTGAVVGTTTADRLGRWQSGFTVGNGTYDVKFEGHFRPIGLAFSGNYYAAGQPVTLKITVSENATGPTGQNGLTGPWGLTGPAGLTGPIGPLGINGAMGLSGPAGPTGPIGLTGNVGTSGPRGLTGPAGVSGPRGLTGPTGSRPAGQVFLSAAGGWPSTTSGCAINYKNELVTNRINIYTLDFDPTSIEYAEWTFAMPSDWNAGTITATFYWMHASTSTNFGVVWGLQGVSYGNNEPADAAWGTAQTVTDIGGTTDTVYISSPTSAITIGGLSPSAGELVQLRVYRYATDPADTLAIDAKLVGIMLSYTRA